jgi:hypothetical protein
MRLLGFLVTSVTLVSYALAQDLTPEVSAEKHHFQVRFRLFYCDLSRHIKRVIRVMLPVFVKS